MNIDKFKAAIKAREQTDDEWTEEVRRIQSNIVDIVCEDIDGAIQYLLTNCSADEFSWLSEVFDDIVTRIPQIEFISALRFLAKKYPEETDIFNIIPFIDSAEGIIASDAKQ